jgi:hypothetical protein
VAEEIELGRPSLGGSGVARSGGGRTSMGAGVFGWTTHAASEGEEIPRDVHRWWRASTAGNGAVAGSSRRWRARGEEKVREARVSAKGAAAGAPGRFYRVRRGRGASTVVMAINGHGGADGLDCIQGEGLNGGGNGRGN